MIKAPVEWAMLMLSMEVQVASTPAYIPDMLFNEAQSKYTTLLNQGLWRLSDKTLEKQMLAMVAQNNNNITKRIRCQESRKCHQIKTPKMWIKKRKHLHLHKNKANWEIPNNGMEKHTTSVPPTTNIHIGTLTSQGL